MACHKRRYIAPSALSTKKSPAGEARSAFQTVAEFLDERQHMGVHDLFGGGDFLKPAAIGWPAHPLRLGDVVPATISAELLP